MWCLCVPGYLVTGGDDDRIVSFQMQEYMHNSFNGHGSDGSFITIDANRMKLYYGPSSNDLQLNVSIFSLDGVGWRWFIPQTAEGMDGIVVRVLIRTHRNQRWEGLDSM